MGMKLIHYFILSCCKATLLMEKKEAKTISSIEKLRLNIHLGICKWCRAYNQKVELIGKMIEKTRGETAVDSFNELEISQFKQRVMQQLEE